MLSHSICENSDKPSGYSYVGFPPGAGRKRAVLGLESRLDDGKGAHARSSVARSWVAITDVRRSAPPAAPRDAARREENAGVVQALPAHGLPVVADLDGDDRGHHVQPPGQGLRRPREAPLARARRAGSARCPAPRPGAAARARSARRAAQRGGTQRRRGRPAVKRKARDWMRRKSRRRPARDKAAARGKRLGERAHAQVDPVLDAEQLRGACARRRARRRRAPVDHQPAPCASHRSMISRAARCRPPSRRRRRRRPGPAAVGLGSLELLGEQVQPPVAERAQLGPRQQAAVEDRGVVAGVGDHRVAGTEDRAERPDVGLVAGREHDRVLRAHPLGDLALEVEVQGDRAVQQARAGQAGAVALRRRRPCCTRSSAVSPR